jgi:hypothetical protein
MEEIDKRIVEAARSAIRDIWDYFTKSSDNLLIPHLRWG